MGVITLTAIDYGHILGPFPTSLARADPTYLIGMLTSDKHPEGPLLQVNLRDNKDGPRAVEWMPYVRPARNEDEQNIEAYMKEGQVYYRTLRIINAKEELFVWYSKDFTQLLGIPELKRNSSKGDDPYICPRCGEVFDQPFTLRAHIKFKCESQPLSPGLISQLNGVCTANGDVLKEMDKACKMESCLGTERQKQTIDERLVSNASLSNRKRRFDSTDEHDVVNRKHSPRSKASEIDHNQNINISVSDSSGENLSAFRKVEKSHSPLQGHSTPMTPSMSTKQTLSPPIGLTFPGHSVMTAPTSASVVSSSGTMPTRSVNGVIHGQVSMFVPRLPMMHPLGFTGSSAITNFCVSEPRQNNLMSPYRNGIVQSNIRRQESLSNMGNSDNVNEMNKQRSIHNERTQIGYAFIKGGGAMVDKMLPTAPTLLAAPAVTALNMCQNWCAKCNASFRMTSDLVYHMRSHHQREFDPMKKKREDKLKCTICNETFRERHHLTRHMTSHTEH